MSTRRRWLGLGLGLGLGLRLELLKVRVRVRVRVRIRVRVRLRVRVRVRVRVRLRVPRLAALTAAPSASEMSTKPRAEWGAAGGAPILPWATLMIVEASSAGQEVRPTRSSVARFCSASQPIPNVRRSCSVEGNTLCAARDRLQGMRLHRNRRLHPRWRLHREGRARSARAACGARGLLIRTPRLVISAQVLQE